MSPEEQATRDELLAAIVCETDLPCTAKDIEEYEKMSNEELERALKSWIFDDHFFG